MLEQSQPVRVNRRRRARAIPPDEVQFARTENKRRAWGLITRNVMNNTALTSRARLIESQSGNYVGEIRALPWSIGSRCTS